MDFKEEINKINKILEEEIKLMERLHKYKFDSFQKIPNIYKRSKDGKILLEGVYTNKYLEYLKDNNWIFTEKIDGTNIRIMWDGYSIKFGGRTSKSNIPSHLYKYLEDEFLNKEEIFEELFGDKQVILFGEGYGHKIQKNGSKYLKDTVSFILFDISVNNIYIDRSEINDIANRFGINTSPVVFTGKLFDAVEYVKKQPLSLVAKDKLVMEGIVGIPMVPVYDNMNNRIIVKIKTRDFVK